MDISIRQVEPGDAPAIKAIYEQPSGYGQTLQLPFPSFDMWEQRLKNRDENFHSLVAEIDGQLVGHISLEVSKHPRRKHVATFGMGVLESVRGRGVGSRLLAEVILIAENWLGVRRLELEVYVDNLPALALYEKHGFEREGIARDFAFRNGEYVDVCHMARLREATQ